MLPVSPCALPYRKLDKIKEREEECGDRQIWMWRADQARDNARKDQIDGGIGISPSTQVAP